MRLAERRYAVVLAARREDELERVAERCRRAGAHEAVVAPTDVTDERRVKELVDATAGRFGRLDVLVNNAGYGLHGAVHEITDEQMRRIFDVNFFGLFYGCRAAAPIMIRQGSGHVFNVSSVIGKRGTPMNGAYCATKFAVVGLTDSMRVELRPHGVNVTCVCPGMTDTDFFDRVEGRRERRKTREPFQSLRTPQSPDVVARRIVATIGRYRPELIFTPGGKFLALVAPLSPRLADRIMETYRQGMLQR